MSSAARRSTFACLQSMQMKWIEPSVLTATKLLKTVRRKLRYCGVDISPVAMGNSRCRMRPSPVACPSMATLYGGSANTSWAFSSARSWPKSRAFWAFPHQQAVSSEKPQIANLRHAGLVRVHRRDIVCRVFRLVTLAVIDQEIDLGSIEAG